MSAPANIPGLRKAAVLVVLLGEEAAAGIFRHLPEADRAVLSMQRELASSPAGGY